MRLAGRSIFEECLTVFDEIRDMEGEIERLGAQLGELDHASPEYDSAAERFSLLQERFHALDGYALDAQVGAVLTGLGFSKQDWTPPDRRVLRRLADANRAGQTAAGQAQPAAARRAHQSPRPRDPQLA